MQKYLFVTQGYLWQGVIKVYRDLENTGIISKIINELLEIFS